MFTKRLVKVQSPAVHVESTVALDACGVCDAIGVEYSHSLLKLQRVTDPNITLMNLLKPIHREKDLFYNLVDGLNESL